MSARTKTNIIYDYLVTCIEDTEISWLVEKLRDYLLNDAFMLDTIQEKQVIGLIEDIKDTYNIKEVKGNEEEVYHYSDNITLEDVYNNLNTLILTMNNIPKELLELQKDIEEELRLLDENYFECNRLIERAYELFDKYIM